MRDDFAVFILTHGRADNLVTLNTLKRQGYTGKWYLIIDNEDEQAPLYYKNFGRDRVVMFDKQAAYDRADTMDNFGQKKAIIYARNECFRIAKELGLTYFLMLDDDYSGFYYRFEEDGKLRGKSFSGSQLEKVFEAMLDFLDVSGAKTVAFSQGGDFIGGANSSNNRFQKGILRKAMNSFFCRVDRPIEFRGTMNEDVTTYATLGSRGDLFFTICKTSLVQLQTQSLDGGMTSVYLDGGTYLKSFYSIMSMPSCIKARMMFGSNGRIHHNVMWEQCVPKIIREEYRKE